MDKHQTNPNKRKIIKGLPLSEPTKTTTYVVLMKYEN